MVKQGKAMEKKCKSCGQAMQKQAKAMEKI